MAQKNASAGTAARRRGSGVPGGGSSGFPVPSSSVSLTASSLGFRLWFRLDDHRLPARHGEALRPRGLDAHEVPARLGRLEPDTREAAMRRERVVEVQL